jgi:ATP-dependent RNA helicase RhlE
MFSATMPPELNRVASEALRDPQRVDLAPPTRPAAGITQAIYPVPRHLKTDLLDQVLLADDVGSAIVFARTKHGADRLARQLQQRGHSWRRCTATASQSPARARARRSEARARADPGGDRHRVARDRRRRHLARDQLRRAAHARGLRPPHRPHRARGRVGDASRS